MLACMKLTLVKPLSYFGLVRLKLNSHSFFASSESLAREAGVPLLLSIKYSPDIPLTCGCNAT